MSVDVRVPATGNAGEDAVIAQWTVSVGAQVQAGDVLVTLETAKAAVEVVAPADGEILELLYGEGDEVAEHSVIATIGDPVDPSVASQPIQPPHAAAPSGTLSSARERLRGDRIGERIKASPRAVILAQRNNVDLGTVTGSGPGGRIITADVLVERNRLRDTAHTDRALSETASAPSPSAPQEPDFELIPVRGPRKVTAQRMQASLQDAAQVTLTRYADAGALLTYITRIRAVADTQSLPRIGVNDALLFAAAKALGRHPEANATFDWDGIRRFSRVNLGFAVDTAQALLVPVIPDADRMSLAELSAAAKACIQKAREGKLTAPEMEGGTFTVTNLGSLGVHWFTPVLNAPQACILGVGATHQSHPAGPHLLPLSLTFDHRALDGAAAAGVLADIVQCIETIDVLSAW